MKFPGYMTVDEALKNGFTHHGKYYGIPVYLALDNFDFPVATKWAPMEGVMTVIAFIETYLRIMFDAGDFFQFAVMGEIEPTKEKVNLKQC
jgi:hypothetical protein